MKITKSYLKKLIKEEFNKINEIEYAKEGVFKYIKTPEEFMNDLKVDDETGEVTGVSHEDFREIGEQVISQIKNIEEALHDKYDAMYSSYKPEAYAQMYTLLKTLEQTLKAINQ